MNRCGNCGHYKQNYGYGLYCSNDVSETSGEVCSPFDGEGCQAHEPLTDMNNYELRWRMLAIIESAELNDFGQEEISKAIEGLGGGLEAVADGHAAANAKDKGNIEAIDVEMKRLNERKQSAVKRIELRKDNIKQKMELAGMKGLKTALFDYSIRKNPHSVVIDKPNDIPACYLTTPEPVPDKLAIKAALKEGLEVPGARLTQTESLRIS